MKIKINGVEMDKHPALINPMHVLVNRMDTDMLRFSTTQTKLDWVATMVKLYEEAGVKNNTLERTATYIRYLKQTKTKKQFFLVVDLIFYNYILNEEGLGTHLTEY